jgi:hypothetical protein
MSAAEVPRTLASVAEGETVTLGGFAFPTLGSVCADLGLHLGLTVLCRVRAPGVLLLEREDGRQISLDPKWARLIGVHPSPVAATGMSPAPPATDANRVA